MASADFSPEGADSVPRFSLGPLPSPLQTHMPTTLLRHSTSFCCPLAQAALLRHRLKGLTSNPTALLFLSSPCPIKWESF